MHVFEAQINLHCLLVLVYIRMYLHRTLINNVINADIVSVSIFYLRSLVFKFEEY